MIRQKSEYYCFSVCLCANFAGPIESHASMRSSLVEPSTRKFDVMWVVGGMFVRIGGEGLGPRFTESSLARA